MRWLTFVAFLFALLAPLAAQDGTLTLTAVFEPATAKPGDKVVLVLSCDVSEGWHAYGTLEQGNTPVSLAPENIKTGGLALDGEPQIPPGMRTMHGNRPTFPLPNQFRVKQPMTVPEGMAAGEVTVTGELDYGICNESGCLPPDKAAFTAKLVVAAGAAGVAATPTPTATEKPATPETTKPGLRLAPGDKITVAAKFDPATARAGEVTTLVLTVTVHDHEWHAYGSLETQQQPVSLPADNVDAGVLERVGDAVVPPGEKKVRRSVTNYPLPPVFDVRQAFRVPAGTKPGPIEVSGALVYQICNETGCEPKAELDFETKLVVEAGDVRAEHRDDPRAGPKPQPPTPDKTTSNEPKGDAGLDGWLALIIACIGGGLFALAMPCTYPMIPITFSFFTKQAEKRGGNVLPLALVYGLGIVVMFMVVGAALSSVIIDIVNHWTVNAVIAVLFLFFAFVLFGWINLNPPQFLTNAAGKASATGGYLGVFFMGATLVITSFTCTAPIVGTLLATVHDHGIVRVTIGMGIFGLTMAAPFVALSLLPGKVKAMPRSGEWMETLKISLGFVELAAALKFVSVVDFAFGWQALPRELFLLLWTAIFGLWAMFLFGLLRKAGSGPNEGVGAGRMASGMAVTLLATYFLFGAMGNKLDKVMTGFIPGYSNSLLSHEDGKGAPKHLGEHQIVFDDPVHALEVARDEDKLLLYNFTGFN
jgi:thiol:disulfide interchange protein DsbD